MADFIDMMRSYKRMCESFQHCDDGCPLRKHNADCTYDDCLTFAFKEPATVMKAVQKWGAENPEPTYPTIKEYLWEMFEKHGVASMTDKGFDIWLRSTEIPAEIAEKLGIEPKERKT